MGAPVDPIRYRANIYFDGAPPWCEHDWIGSAISLGSARLQVITRCAATQVNPVTAERDLERAFGHINMGVYAEVSVGAEIAVGDQLSIYSSDSAYCLSTVGCDP
jgi:uncharacterized protein